MLILLFEKIAKTSRLDVWEGRQQQLFKSSKLIFFLVTGLFSALFLCYLSITIVHSNFSGGGQLEFEPPLIKKSRWRRVANVPMKFQEGSCTWHQSELWCCGGYDNAKCASFSPESEAWTMRPSLPDITHHFFNSMFSLSDDSLVILGGLKGVNPSIGHHHLHWLDTSTNHSGTDGNINLMKKSWFKRTDLFPELDLGGMVSCTIRPIGRLYFCNLRSDPQFTHDETRFVSFDPSNLSVQKLTVPPVSASHGNLVADPIRQRVIYFGFRTNTDNEWQWGPMPPDVHYYDIGTDTWDEVDTVSQMDGVPRLEARAFYQHSSTLYGYLAGGQHQWFGCVHDAIYKFILDPDPTIRAIRFVPWSRLPGQGGFGGIIAEVPPGSGQLLYVGGSKAVGPFPSYESYFWDQSRQPLTDHDGPHPDSSNDDKVPPLQIVSATLGYHDVTTAVQTLVDEGWTGFTGWTLPDLGLPDEVQWTKGGYRMVTKTSNNKTYRTGIASDMLMVKIREKQGSDQMRLYMCHPMSGCKFSFWNEEEEIKHLMLTWNSTFMPFDVVGRLTSSVL